MLAGKRCHHQLKVVVVERIRSQTEHREHRAHAHAQTPEELGRPAIA